MKLEDVVLPQDDPAGKLAEFASNLKYEDIPEEHIEYIKKDILDSMCSFLAGSTGPNIHTVLESIRSWGETGKGTAIIFGDKLPMSLAAFLNGTVARACDLGDTGVRGGHICEWIIPTLLTALNRLGRPVSGKEFITAFVAGAEWGTREHATIQVQENNRSVPSECAGSRFATVSLAKLFGFNKEQMWNAAGMSYCAHTMTTPLKYAEGTPDPRLQHGFASEDALTIVDLVSRGLHSVHGIYMSPAGLLKSVKVPVLSPTILFEDLGKRWYWREGITNKLYAGCYYNHTPIYGAISLMKQHNIRKEDIRSIHYITSNAGDHTWVPAEVKYNPTVRESAMWSAPYSVTNAVFYGDCFLNAYEEDVFKRNMADPEFVAFMQKCTQECDSSIKPAFTDYICRITLNDGREYAKVVDDLPGSTAVPVTWEQVIDKFWKCTKYSAVDLGEEKYNRVIEICKNFENEPDVSVLLEAMIP